MRSMSNTGCRQHGIRYWHAPTNTDRQRNTAIGSGALVINDTGSVNTATGASALFANTLGAQNTASGNEALFSNTIGVQNTATGAAALFSNTTAAATRPLATKRSLATPWVTTTRLRVSSASQQHQRRPQRRHRSAGAL